MKDNCMFCVSWKLVWVCAEARYWSLLYHAPPYSETGSVTWNAPLRLGRLINNLESSVSLCPPMLGLQVHTGTAGFLHGCWRSELRSLCLHRKYFKDWVISPALWQLTFLICFLWQLWTRRKQSCQTSSSALLPFLLRAQCNNETAVCTFLTMTEYLYVILQLADGLLILGHYEILVYACIVSTK